MFCVHRPSVEGNKALSDTWCNVKFSFCFTSKYKAIWKKNLVVNQMSLGAFFHTPLQFLTRSRSNCPSCEKFKVMLHGTTFNATADALKVAPSNMERTQLLTQHSFAATCCKFLKIVQKLTMRCRKKFVLKVVYPPSYTAQPLTQQCFILCNITFRQHVN